MAVAGSRTHPDLEQSIPDIDEFRFGPPQLLPRRSTLRAHSESQGELGSSLTVLSSYDLVAKALSLTPDNNIRFWRQKYEHRGQPEWLRER